MKTQFCVLVCLIGGMFSGCTTVVDKKEPRTVSSTTTEETTTVRPAHGYSSTQTTTQVR